MSYGIALVDLVATVDNPPVRPFPGRNAPDCFFFLLIWVVVESEVDLVVIVGFDGKNQNNRLESFILGMVSCGSMGSERERFVDILGRCGTGGNTIAFALLGATDTVTLIVIVAAYFFCFP